MTQHDVLAGAGSALQRVADLERELRHARAGLQATIASLETVNEAQQGVIETLRNANDELQQFAHAASHDLQEPLRMIASYLDLLETRCGDSLSHEGTEFLEFARDGARRLQHLLAGLLEFSRVESRARPEEVVSSNEVFDDTVVLMRELLDARGASVERDDLPAVCADRRQLGQVFHHLLRNAVEFCEKAPAIRVAGSTADGFARFEVSDNGLGVDARHHDRVFVIFQRLHTNDEHPGNGIGLAVCKRIAERHGGTVGVRSTAGEGSSFWFTMPIPHRSS